MDILKHHGWWIVILLVLGAVLASGVNTLPTLDEKVKAAWSQVENQYQRRLDLVPNLVTVVKGYADFEQKTLTDVVNARANATKIVISADAINNPDEMKKFEQAQSALGTSLSRLLAVSERYPDLKANEQFLTLQAQLEGTENRIAIARKDYIDAVQTYNTTARTFPGFVWARIYGVSPKQTFEAASGAEQVPAVKFQN